MSREQWGALWMLLFPAEIFLWVVAISMMLAGIFAWHSHLWPTWFMVPPELTAVIRWYARRRMLK
jgi:hypothetical protein